MKVFDEEVIFKQPIHCSSITIENSGADLTVVDDLNVTDDAIISGDLTVAGTLDQNGNVTVNCTAVSVVCTTSYVSCSQNLWNLASFDHHVSAANVLAVNASSIEIGTKSTFTNAITIGDASYDNQVKIPLVAVDSLTNVTTKVLAAGDCGKLWIIGGVSTLAITLPEPATGMNIKFAVLAETSATTLVPKVATTQTICTLDTAGAATSLTTVTLVSSIIYDVYAVSGTKWYVNVPFGVA